MKRKMTKKVRDKIQASLAADRPSLRRLTVASRIAQGLCAAMTSWPTGAIKGKAGDIADTALEITDALLERV